jgi:hypothetical protein
MFVSFESLPANARIWIYQSDRKLSAEEKTIIDNDLKLFTDRWVAHGEPLKTSFKIAYDQFVILAADEDHHSQSGCSIDDSVRTIQELGNRLGLDFFNRNLVAFQIGDNVRLITLQSLRQELTNGTWNENTCTFNNVVTHKGGLETDWVRPASETWLKRYLTTERVVKG